MSARAHSPTNEVATELFDEERQGALRAAPPPSATPLDPHPPIEAAAPIERSRLERSEPIRAISMKDHTAATKPRSEGVRGPLSVQLSVQLRSMAEVAGRNDTPVRLGHLAPPRDPRQARARRVRDNVVWAGVAVALACAISLAIWFIAGG
jgi:hypothetical protein